MVDHSADHITTEEAAQLIETLRGRLEGDGVRFHPGVSYRHLTIVDGEAFAQTRCTPPHDILGQPIAGHLPGGPGAERLRQLMEASVAVLRDHPVNRARRQAGKRPANMLWFWGQGTAVAFPAFQSLYGRRGACISAVDIVRGIARLAGMEVLQVPGITGYFDTNYRGKAEHALRALEEGRDLVVIHVESTDEAGHMGDAAKKVQAIEDVDRQVVGPVLEGLRRGGGPFAVLVTPDHPTSTAARTHIAEPVPFALYATDGPRDGAPAYSEPAVRNAGTRFEQGFELMGFFLSPGRTNAS